MDLSQLEIVCRGYVQCSPNYFVEPIPDVKATNARKELQVPSAERIFALLDFTILGSAKEALLVTQHGVRWKNAASPARSLSWIELGERSLSETYRNFTKFIEFGEGLELCLDGARGLVAKDNHTVIELLSRLAEEAAFILQSALYQSHTQHSTSADEPHGGLVHCEFCNNQIKPKVTFCKFCGIKLRG